MKPRTKKILILAGTTLLLCGLTTFKVNTDFLFAKSINLNSFAQNRFWDHDAGTIRFEKATGATNSYSFGGGRDGGPRFAHFTLILNDEYKAEYSNTPYPGQENIFNITVNPRQDVEIDNDANKRLYGFTFYANKKDFKIIEDDNKYQLENETSPQDREKIDMQDNISEKKKLKQLAIKRLKEAQDKYYNK